MKFEFYVLRYDWNKKKVVRWNIFNNIKVQERTENAIKKYLRNKAKYKYTSITTNETVFGFEALCKEIDSILKWQLWSRREYEISVSDAVVKEARYIEGDMKYYETLDDLKDFISDIARLSPKLEKWDCYGQCKENVEIIARECIYQYKKQKKENK